MANVGVSLPNLYDRGLPQGAVTENRGHLQPVYIRARPVRDNRHKVQLSIKDRAYPVGKNYCHHVSSVSESIAVNRWAHAITIQPEVVADSKVSRDDRVSGPGCRDCRRSRGRAGRGRADRGRRKGGGGREDQTITDTYEQARTCIRNNGIHHQNIHRETAR